VKTTSASRKFSRYAATSAAALGAAAAARAEFTGNYALTPPAAGTFTNTAANGTFGNWTATKGGTSSAPTGWTLTTTDAGTSLTLGVTGSSGAAGSPTLTFLSTAAAAGNVNFNFNATASGPEGHSFFYTADGSTYNLITSATYGSSRSFAVANGATFGFRVTATYTFSASSMQAVISGFTAPTAIPEPGTAGLLAGCAALGFVGLTGVREMRRRAAQKSA
jgi:hypothetical protein